MEDHDSRKQAAFWEAYRGCAEENRVPPDRSQYYLRWVKEFVEFIPEKRLKARSGKDIEAFLAALGQREGIAQWQVRQAEQVLMGWTGKHLSAGGFEHRDWRSKHEGHTESFRAIDPQGTRLGIDSFLIETPLS